MDSVLLPNPFKDPDGWFDALDTRRCGRVPRSSISDALTVATKLEPDDVNAILDATMGGNRHDQYDCMDGRYILARVEKLTVGAAMDSMRTFSRLELQTRGHLEAEVDSDDDVVDAWILSVTERRCARSPDEVSSPMDSMAALAELGLQRRELASAMGDL